MIMMRTERIPECGAAEGAVQAMSMTMTVARVRRTRRAVRKGPAKGWKQRTGRIKETERETERGKVLLNEPLGVVISHMLLLCSCRSKYQRRT
jgi:hypothetical protein